jgi:hypothetical protein
LSLQLTGVYQNVGYSGVENTSAYIAYGYYDATAGVDWKLSPRSDVSVGVDGSEESAKDVYSVTKGHGIVVTYNYQWSKVFTGSLSVLGEQYDIYGLPPNTTVPVSPRSTSSGVGASYQTTWKGQISQLQLTVGRTFTPNGAGGSYTSDQFQFEYRRQLSPRLSFDGAAHYIQNDALSREYDAGNYDYLIATADLKWNLTRTWFVGGGLQYLETKSPVAGTSANDSMLHVGFGYEGLGRQY